MSVTDVGAVSISDCACSLHAEVHILAVYAKYVAPPTKSMSAPARRAAAKISMQKNRKTSVSNGLFVHKVDERSF